jgi:hypothetical protein
LANLPRSTQPSLYFGVASNTSTKTTCTRCRRESDGGNVTGIEPATSIPQEKVDTQVTASPSITLAQSLAREMQIDSDLARLMDAWPTLSAPVKRMILAALEAIEPKN